MLFQPTNRDLREFSGSPRAESYTESPLVCPILLPSDDDSRPQLRLRFAASRRPTKKCPQMGTRFPRVAGPDRLLVTLPEVAVI